MPDSTTCRIVPAEGGRWLIMSDKGTAVLANRDYPTPEVAVEAIGELARSQGLEMAVTYRPDGKIDHVEIGKDLRSSLPARPTVKLTLTLPAEMDDLLDNMSEEMGMPKGEVIKKAIGLLMIALDAKREGNRIAIIDPDLEVDQEITGI